MFVTQTVRPLGPRDGLLFLSPWDKPEPGAAARPKAPAAMNRIWVKAHQDEKPEIVFWLYVRKDTRCYVHILPAYVVWGDERKV